MKLYQLANDPNTYGKKALWWLVVTDDGELELSPAYPTRRQAEGRMKRIEEAYQKYDACAWHDPRLRDLYILDRTPKHRRCMRHCEAVGAKKVAAPRPAERNSCP